MIVVQNHLRVKEEFTEAFEKAFRERAHSVDGFQGFIRNEVLRPVKGEDYIVMTYWNTMEDFDRWLVSDEFRNAHSGARLPHNAFAGESDITVHEIISGSG